MSPPANGSPSALQALSRFQIIWTVSTLLLVLLIAVLTVLVAGHLRRQSDALNRHERELADLRARLLAIEPAAWQHREPAPPSSPADRPDAGASAASQPASGPQQGNITIRTEMGRGNAEIIDGDEEPPSRLTAEAVAEALDRLLVERDDLPDPLLTDPRAAVRLLDDVGDGQQFGQSWSGKLWSRLALLAALAGRESQADVYAYHAARGGFVPRGYLERRTARLLDEGKAAEALQTARRLGPVERLTPRSRVALAAAYAANREWGPADEHASAVASDAALPAAIRLRLCDTLAALDRWEPRAAHLRRVGEVAPQWAAERDRLQAEFDIHAGRATEALVVLERLLQTRPDDARLQILHARALHRIGRSDEARIALEAVPLQENADAWYQRSVLELSLGRPDPAEAAARKAVELDPRHFMAWEALGAAALNADRLDDAQVALLRAAELHPRRGEAKLLLAIVSARRGNKPAAEAALRETLQRDPSLLVAARTFPVLEQLFSDEEWGKFDQPASASAPAAAP